MRSTSLANFRIENWLPYWLPLDDLIAALAALAVLATLLAIWFTLQGGSPFERRFEEIVQRKERLRQNALQSRRRQRPDPSGLMREAVTRLNLLRSRHANEAQEMLARAGIRAPDAVVRYLFAQFTLPFLFGAVVLTDTYYLHVIPIPEHLRLVPPLAAVLLGFYAPKLYLRNTADKRAKRVQLALPDGLDLMVICAEAGLSLDATLVRVSRELGSTWPELAEELGLTAAELTFMPDRRVALDNLNSRTNSEGIRGVVNTLLQTAKFGTPLARSLRVLSAEFRDQRMTKAEEKAARLPALLTVPMIVFILPTLFIVLLGPAALGVIDTFSHGHGSPAATPSEVHEPKKDDGGMTPNDVVDDGKGEQSGPVVATGPAHKITVKHDRAAEEARAAAAAAAHARIVPSRASLRLIDPIVVQVDARPLRAGFHQRLAVVPAGTSDAITDMTAFTRDSMPIEPARLRVALAPAAPGRDEVRLYYIPQFGSTYVVAARATIQVAAGAHGATPAAQLIQQADAAMPDDFAARYRGRPPILLEGQFLRAEPVSGDQLAAVPALAGLVDPAARYTAVTLGWTDAPAPLDNGPAVLTCLAPAEDAALAKRLAALQPGDAITLKGAPVTWGPFLGAPAVIVRSCRLAP
jgi:tight adherence protein C